ncbi:MAG: LacI family DNA-binding transcriptional regulator [Colwellia sp.]|nr:LacI family DNA-binding transcriptional regulator [Colwellia sp.]
MNKELKTRLQDVAKHSGVSMMTVSRVLNKNGMVSDKTRAKVQVAVKELNYRPNVSARRLASSKSFFLGLLYDNPSTSYVSQFLLGSLKFCRASGYHLVVDEADNDLAKTLKSVKELINITQVDGLILLPPVCDIPEVLDTLTTANIPFVRVSPNSQLHISPYVCMDDYQAAFEITEQLINQGHINIAHIIGHPDVGASRLRYQGFLDALRSNKISVPPEYIEQGYFTYKSGLSAAQKLLSLENRPSAIFASNDDMAAASISAAHMNNIQVPSALSVVGFDDTSLASTVWPHISTVRQPIQEMAKMAVELLVSGKFDDPTSTKKSDLRHVLDFEIIQRESSAELR